MKKEGTPSLGKWASGKNAVFDRGKPIQYENLAGRSFENGIDAFFYGRWTDAKKWGEMEHPRQPVNPSKFWSPTDRTGTLDLPKDKRITAAYAKNPLWYPEVNINAELPDLSSPVGNEDTLNLHFGLENGGIGGNGHFGFNLRTEIGDFTNRLRVIGGPMETRKRVNINTKKPADFDTARHRYTVRAGKGFVSFEIDHEIACIFIPSKDTAEIVKENKEPYSIALTPYSPSEITPFVEWNVNRTETADEDMEADIPPYWFRAASGHELPPTRLPLYVEDSTDKLTAVDIDKDTTTHPFPLNAYPGKTIYLRADTAGDLDIEIRTEAGNWRTYDTVSISADTLEGYSLAADAVLGRVVYRPDSTPASVTDAEIVLR